MLVRCLPRCLPQNRAVSSRYALDSRGRLITEVTTPGAAPPLRYLVLGNAVRAGERGIYFLEAEARTGRRNPVTQPRRTNRDPLPLDAS
jgi:hypothetical protein